MYIVYTVEYPCYFISLFLIPVVVYPGQEIVYMLYLHWEGVHWAMISTARAVLFGSGYSEIQYLHIKPAPEIQYLHMKPSPEIQYLHIKPPPEIQYLHIKPTPEIQHLHIKPMA